MSRVRCPNSSDGFVLLEALVSLILLSMILALFAAALTFARRVSDAGKAQEGILEASAGVNAMSRLLASAMPSRETGPGGEGPVLFDGDGYRLSFVTLGNGETQPGGLLAVTLAFDAPEQRSLGAIVFGSSPVKAGVHPKTPNTRNHVLVGNVMNAKFSYFGSPRENAPATWHGEWRHASRLPAVVALRANVELNGRSEVLDLTFRIVSN